MSSFDIPVIPKDETTTITITKFVIDNIDVAIFKSALISVSIFSTDTKFIKSIPIPMTTEEYLGWGSNDEYIINFVCSKLGLTRE